MTTWHAKTPGQLCLGSASHDMPESPGGTLFSVSIPPCCCGFFAAILVAIEGRDQLWKLHKTWGTLRGFEHSNMARKGYADPYFGYARFQILSELRSNRFNPIYIGKLRYSTRMDDFCLEVPCPRKYPGHPGPLACPSCRKLTPKPSMHDREFSTDYNALSVISPKFYVIFPTTRRR